MKRVEQIIFSVLSSWLLVACVADEFRFHGPEWMLSDAAVGITALSVTPKGSAVSYPAIIDGKEVTVTVPRNTSETALSAATISVTSTEGTTVYYNDAPLTTEIAVDATAPVDLVVKGNDGVELVFATRVYYGENGRPYVDLGLPSGTLWAVMNVGAFSATDYGDYFAWGETTGYNSGKSLFDWSTYKYCQGSYDTMTKYCTSSSDGTVDNKTELDLSDDAAHAAWGGSWRMPSNEQFQELMDECIWEWTMINGVNGYKVSSKKNSNVVFFPAAGYYGYTPLNSEGYEGSYWSRSLNTGYSSSAYKLHFYPESMWMYESNSDRYYGRSVRPVTYRITKIEIGNGNLLLVKGQNTSLTVTTTPLGAILQDVTWTSLNPSVATVSESGVVTAVGVGTATITVASVYYSEVVKGTCTIQVVDTDYYEAVDLGLTSGTLWANMNVGAASATDYGDYFAWGETSGYNASKKSFSWDTYLYCNGTDDTMTKYCTGSSYGTVDNKTELELSDDAARAAWGGSWRMPSTEQFQELKDECTWTWTTMNGVNGYKVSSKKNSNYIFFPAAGSRSTSLSYEGSYGYYWSRSLDTSISYYACGVSLHSMYASLHTYRYFGRSVRPVIDGPQ